MHFLCLDLLSHSCDSCELTYKPEYDTMKVYNGK